MIQIVCACKKLVEVVDKVVVEHEVDGERCPVSGMRYVSKKFSSGPSAPSFEVVAHGPIDCPGCGEPHGHGALIRVNVPDPNLN